MFLSEYRAIKKISTNLWIFKRKFNNGGSPVIQKIRHVLGLSIGNRSYTGRLEGAKSGE